MKIEGLGLPQPPDPKGKKAREIKQADNTAENQRQVSDSIQISKNAQKQVEASYVQKIRKGGESEAENVRDLTEYKQKSAQGYYDSVESKEQTSEKLIASDDLKEVIKEYHYANVVNENIDYSAEVRHDKVAEIKKKVADGYYDDPTNFGNIADKLMNHFGV